MAYGDAPNTNGNTNGVPGATSQPTVSVGEQTLQAHADETLQRVQGQGGLALERLKGRYGPEALALRQQQAQTAAIAGQEGANNLQDSAQQQYGVELTESQLKAQKRMRNLRRASARAAASNNTASQFFEERIAAISDAANIGNSLENTAIGGISSALNTSQQIAMQNQQLSDQHMSGLGGLVGMGMGFAMGGPMGAMMGSSAGAAIF